jgi:hypothetical protein
VVVPREQIRSFDDDAARAVEARLVQIAQHFEGALKGRVKRLLLCAAISIHKLAELDLVRQQADEDQGGHTLALWEDLAPVTGATVEAVNELIAEATKEFPAAAEDESVDDLDAAFGPSKGPSKVKDETARSTEAEIAFLVAGVCSGMRRDVTRLGERLRNPTVMSDPWMLIQDLLEFRGRVRAAAGELMYQVSSFVAEVERQEVVPGYAAELEGGLIVRQATSNLAFLFRGHTKRVAAAADDRILAVLQDALKDLHAFSRTRALPAMRTSDKRIFLETRAALYQLAKVAPPRSTEIKNAVENMAKFLESMSVVSRRENLRLHDREQLARAGRHLEAAQFNLSTAEVARRELADSLQAAAALYGRDPQLDAYLRAQRHFPVDWLRDPELAIEVERFAALLAAIAMP